MSYLDSCPGTTYIDMRSRYRRYSTRSPTFKLNMLYSTIPNSISSKPLFHYVSIVWALSLYLGISGGVGYSEWLASIVTGLGPIHRNTAIAE